jgi:integrase
VALTVKRIQKLLHAGLPGRHTDVGGIRGLMLCIESKTSASWAIRYQRLGVVRLMGLGSARDLSLAAARELARRERERLAGGIDPLERRRAERAAAKAATTKHHNFRDTVERFFAAKESGWSNARHRDEFMSSLQRWVFPVIGTMDVTEIGKDEILRVLEQKIKGGGTFWHDRAVTADRTRSRIESVMGYAAARGWLPPGTPNPAKWEDFLEHLLARPRDIRPVRHLRAMPYAEIPGLMAKLARDPTIGARTLQFIIMTACRRGEALGATLDEFQFDTAEWLIPGRRMKNRREHRVPLSPQVLALLADLPREAGNDFVFVSAHTAGKAVSDTALNRALRAARCLQTIHGFRSSFRDWAEERSRFNNTEIEMSLAHSVGSAVERSYRRTDLFEKRRRLMAAWSVFCCTPLVGADANKVLPMKRLA